MKLEIKHVAPYLPYGLRCSNTKSSYLQELGDRIGILEQMNVADNDGCVIMGNNGYFLTHYTEIKPVFRPLSDLFKTQDNGKDFLCGLESKNNHQVIGEFLDHIRDFTDKPYQISLDCCPIWIYTKFLENHFDVFGLIPEGLAIDINTLKITL